METALLLYQCSFHTKINYLMLSPLSSLPWGMVGWLQTIGLQLGYVEYQVPYLHSIDWGPTKWYPWKHANLTFGDFPYQSFIPWSMLSGWGHGGIVSFSSRKIKMQIWHQFIQRLYRLNRIICGYYHFSWTYRLPDKDPSRMTRNITK